MSGGAGQADVFLRKSVELGVEAVAGKFSGAFESIMSEHYGDLAEIKSSMEDDMELGPFYRAVNEAMESSVQKALDTCGLTDAAKMCKGGLFEVLFPDVDGVELSDDRIIGMLVDHRRQFVIDEVGHSMS